MKCPWILLNALPSARDDDNGSCFKNYSFETSDRIKSPCPAYPTTRIRNSFSSSSSSSVRHNKAASPSSSSSSSRCRSLYRSNSGRASVVTGRNIKIGEYMNDFITVRYIICSSTLQKQTSCPFSVTKAVLVFLYYRVPWTAFTILTILMKMANEINISKHPLFNRVIRWRYNPPHIILAPINPPPRQRYPRGHWFVFHLSRLSR